jgi:hypothetical protein
MLAKKRLSHRAGARAANARSPFFDSTMAPDTRDRPPQRCDLHSLATRALDAVERAALPLLDDASVSGEHALHVVVLDPHADRAQPFEQAVLVERSIGSPERWQADYGMYARAKARLAHRERCTTAELLAQRPVHLRPGDLVVEGAVSRNGWIVAASGAQPWYDAAFAGMTIELIHAGLRHALAQAQADGGRW